MNDITRDDLRWRCRDICCQYDDNLDSVTDEEFDRLAREAGYCKPSDTFRTEATDDQ